MRVLHAVGVSSNIVRSLLRTVLASHYSAPDRQKSTLGAKFIYLLSLCNALKSIYLTWGFLHQRVSGEYTLPSSTILRIPMRAPVMKEGSSVARFARTEEDVFRISEGDDRQSSCSASPMLGNARPCRRAERERDRTEFVFY